MRALFLFIFSPLLIFASSILDIQALGLEQYQDIIINNKVHRKANYGHRDCKKRYELIKTHLEKYRRPFTLIDIGASQGYYGLRCAHDFNCVAVMLDGNNPAYPHTGDQLLTICNANTNRHNIIHLNEPIKPKSIQRLSECEHFDVTLAMNILHWFGNQWRSLAESLIAMGDYLIIETPPFEQKCTAGQKKLRKEILQFIQEQGGELMGTAPRHLSDQESPIYLLHTSKKSLQRTTWFKKATNRYEILSTFDEKKLIKHHRDTHTQVVTQWIPGINLITFKMMHGAYPTTKQLLEALERLKSIQHNDWMVNNMVLQGDKLTFIDWDDPTHAPGGQGGGRHFSPAHYYRTRLALAIKDPEKFESFFWSTLVARP